MRNRTLDMVKAISAYAVVLLHVHFPGNAGIIALIQKPFRPVPESKIVVRFWIIGIILAVITIVTLKMR